MSTKTKKNLAFKDLILFEDEDIILINKPLNVASLDDKSQQNIHFLAKEYDNDLRLCHRLDKNTSGVLLLCRKDENYRNISIQFEKRKVKKTYHTIVGGVHRFDQLEVDLPIYVSTNKKVSISHANGKPSKTIFETNLAFRNYTLINCYPVSGRMHQIRVHLSAISCPIVGDSLYGGEDILLSNLKRNYKYSMRKEERPVNHGYMLHAHELNFTHPQSGEAMSVAAPYPKNFETTLKILRKYNS
ncbi:MAG: RluA family pseudouridine synthase [Bacteroidia bacterium]|nr:RluA family pseudouridine synthase [Bacteroidia bacterium]